MIDRRRGASAAPRRWRIRVGGLVQGVGFRPFTRNLAAGMGLSGFVLNDSEGVLIEIQTPAEARGEASSVALDAFTSALRAKAPPRARIERLESAEILPLEARDIDAGDGFLIAPSRMGPAYARIGPDAACCPACLRDMVDPESRFYAYPFVNCVDCGPRFTLTAALPYDRARTSMAAFRMCAACAGDYDNPNDRRHHAEAIACPACGPKLSHSPHEIAAHLLAGKIVALKGIGGYHLICDAREPSAVARLREIKARDFKPFALMAADEAALETLAAPSEAERRLVASPARPIVLMAVAPAARLPETIAPNLARIGVMLPYAPMHHLIFAAAAEIAGKQDRAFVVTSANPGGAPVIVDDAQANAQLGPFVDLLVRHDRAILARADDSVMAVIDGAPAFLRRARGFVPEPIDLGADGPSLIACGGHLKATICVARGREAFVSQHIGSLSDPDTIRFYRETARHFLKLLNVRPELAACDLHPDYYSTRYAEDTGLPIMRIQHHAAHIAAVAVEHGLRGTVLGLALDGHGYGGDGGAWGGEKMEIADGDWRRLGWLKPLPLPGGDRAARAPWRMGLAALSVLGRLDEAAARWPEQNLSAPLLKLLSQGGCPATSSLGRVFDAAAALLGLRAVQDYEGQAAMELEALVKTPRAPPDAFRLEDGVLDFSPLLEFLIAEKFDARAGAEFFHGGVIEGLFAWINDGVAERGAAIALGGGCLMNRILAEGLADRLRATALRPYLPRAVPANDGGLSLGQAALARAKFERQSLHDQNARN